MNKDIARHLIRVNFRCSRELQEVIQLLKRQLSDKAYEPAAHKIAAAISAVRGAAAETFLYWTRL
ncbi:MAG: hypothetical protein EKK40_18905 [Bradyrhizobiaceae bacterium]|nr:MAG: hypothetical protein EKK40_18905 [Bradyrhizobiaceae bacterium]